MPNVKTPPGGVPPQAAQQAAAEQSRHQASVANRDGVHTGRHRESKQHHAAGKQAQESPLAEYMRPHRVHTSAERNAAQARKHAAELLDEAARYVSIEEQYRIQNQTEAEEDQKIKGINFDERRKKKGKQQSQGEESEEVAAENEAAKTLGFTDGTGKYFQDLPADRMGDLSLTSPNEIKRLLGPSVRFAQHAMLLAEHRQKQGMPRSEVVEFLASLYLGLADRAYANKALKSFGPATGIIDIYPLEVMQHLLEHVPAFLSKVSAARFLAKVPVGGYKGETGKAIVLRYDPALRIRGFALQGGDKPGYLFEPVDPQGTYHLTFATPGKFTVMISALSKEATVMIEEFEVTIAQGKSSDLESASVMQRAKASLEDVDPDAPRPAEDAEAASALGQPAGIDSSRADAAAEPTTGDVPRSSTDAGRTTTSSLKLHFPRRI